MAISNPSAIRTGPPNPSHRQARKVDPRKKIEYNAATETPVKLNPTAATDLKEVTSQLIAHAKTIRRAVYDNQRVVKRPI